MNGTLDYTGCQNTKGVGIHRVVLDYTGCRNTQGVGFHRMLDQRGCLDPKGLVSL